MIETHARHAHTHAQLHVHSYTCSADDLLICKAAIVKQAACSTFREKQRLEAEAIARFEREEEEARVAAEAAAAAER